MSQKTIVTRYDDLNDNSIDVQTVQFSYDGTDYEIDLDKSNRIGLRSDLAPYIGAARRVTRRPVAGSRAQRSSSRTRSDTRVIRAWAAEQGIPVADRGRIPDRVRAAYEAAHSADGRTLGAVA